MLILNEENWSAYTLPSGVMQAMRLAEGDCTALPYPPEDYFHCSDKQFLISGYKEPVQYLSQIFHLPERTSKVVVQDDFPHWKDVSLRCRNSLYHKNSKMNPMLLGQIASGETLSLNERLVNE